VEFLPPNTTTELQPCDAGIIHSFKCHYKIFLFRIELINAYDGVQQTAAEAWSMMPSQTICWKKTRILPPNDFEEFEDYDSVISDRYGIIIK
jgi:hypothetical protein